MVSPTASLDTKSKGGLTKHVSPASLLLIICRLTGGTSPVQRQRSLKRRTRTRKGLRGRTAEAAEDSGEDPAAKRYAGGGSPCALLAYGYLARGVIHFQPGWLWRPHLTGPSLW